MKIVALTFGILSVFLTGLLASSIVARDRESREHDGYVQFTAKYERELVADFAQLKNQLAFKEAELIGVKKGLAACTATISSLQHKVKHMQAEDDRLVPTPSFRTQRFDK